MAYKFEGENEIHREFAILFRTWNFEWNKNQKKSTILMNSRQFISLDNKAKIS